MAFIHQFQKSIVNIILDLCFAVAILLHLKGENLSYHGTPMVGGWIKPKV